MAVRVDDDHWAALFLSLSSLEFPEVFLSLRDEQSQDQVQLFEFIMLVQECRWDTISEQLSFVSQTPSGILAAMAEVTVCHWRSDPWPRMGNKGIRDSHDAPEQPMGVFLRALANDTGNHQPPG
jgi:hypothetical protein